MNLFQNIFFLLVRYIAGTLSSLLLISRYGSEYTVGHQPIFANKERSTFITWACREIKADSRIRK